MRLAAWSRLSIEARHFEIELEILLAFIAAGTCSSKFAPVQSIWYKDEISKIHPLRDTACVGSNGSAARVASLAARQTS